MLLLFGSGLALFSADDANHPTTAGQSFREAALLASEDLPALPEVASLPMCAVMPDQLVTADRELITTVAQWQQRRKQMKQIIEHYAIGHLPPPPGNVTGRELFSNSLLEAKVTCRFVHLTFGPENKLGFDVAIFIPTDTNTFKSPFPMIVQPVFLPMPGTNSWENVVKQFAEPLRRGYAVAAFYYQQCGADKPDYRQTGFFPAYPGYDWGDLAAWAWGMSRCVDYLETQPFVDKSQIIAVGHSRLGKAALIAGAFDERFALTAPAGSGCGGTGAYRFNGQGRGGKEGLEEATKRFPQWFGPHLPEFSGQVEKLPFDQHWFLALVAPRLFLAADGLSDPYASTNALVQSYLAAKPVYELLGVPEHLAINFRPGGHLLATADWQAILDFSDQQLRKLEVKRLSNQTPPVVDWVALTSPILFHGDAQTAYRDPMLLYHDGVFWMYFTLNTHDAEGRPFWQTAYSTSTNLVHWSDPVAITPCDRHFNFCSPGNIVRFNGQWVLCLQTYPTPGNSTYGDDSSRLWLMSSDDLAHWSEPELIRFMGPEVAREAMPRMIDPYLLEDKEEPGKWWCFCKIKQTGVSMAWTRDLKTWHPAGRVDGGENACVLVQEGEYVLFHSPPNGIGVKRSRDLHTWGEDGLLTLGQKDWPWAQGRLTAGYVLDGRAIPGVGRYVMVFHGSGPEDERTMFHTHASIGIAWSDDLKTWCWPGGGLQTIEPHKVSK